ncbi:MAG: ABC transporter ATP-binding protein [Firmicutes bacterium]|nr:ABC transporter ATP-binding protein [Bacillota bacterium]
MILETNGLTKWYGRQLGCEDICLSVEEGQVFGFLGPNGAGKSTVVKMLVGLIFPTSGSALILGRPLGNVDARRRVGFLPENFRYPEWLTGRELLRYHASLYRIESRRRERRVAEVIEMVGLKGREGDRIKSYSKGMQQRVGLASALLSDPDLVFLDEPSSALDPIGRREVRELILSLKRQGKTVFLNSHLLSEVEQICDQVAIIKRGRVAAQGDYRELSSGGMELEIELGGLSEHLLSELRARGCQYRLIQLAQKPYQHRLQMSVSRRDQAPEIARLLVEQGADLYSLALRQPSLEEIFVRIMEEN